MTNPSDPLNAFAPSSVTIIIFFVSFIAWYTSVLGISHLMFAYYWEIYAGWDLINWIKSVLGDGAVGFCLSVW